VRAGVRAAPVARSGRARRMRATALAAAAAAGITLSAGGAALAAVSAYVRIDQSPILRVLRSSDVPKYKNEELPSGALSLSQFVADVEPTTAAAAAEARILSRAGFISSAISEFYGPGRLFLKSTVAELGSPALASGALAADAANAARAQAPPHDRVARAGDHAFGHAILLTFTPPVAGWAGGVEVLAVAGNYLYTLKGISKPDAVSRESIDRLLAKVMSHS